MKFSLSFYIINVIPLSVSAGQEITYIHNNSLLLSYIQYIQYIIHRWIIQIAWYKTNLRRPGVQAAVFSGWDLFHIAEI